MSPASALFNSDPASPQAQALRRVNLHMLGIVHGEPMNDKGFTYYGGVSDRDYQEASQLVDQLDATRGDMLGLECFGHDSRPWINQMTGRRDPAPRQKDLESQALLHQIGPMQYAAAKAAGQGIMARAIDLAKYEVIDLREEVDSLPCPARLLFYSFDRHHRYREKKILAKLAMTAEGMTNDLPPHLPVEERPTLAYMIGATHLRSLRKILFDVHVPVVTNYRPGRHGHGTKYLHTKEVLTNGRAHKRMLRKRYEKLGPG